jgi:uncharacterized protein YndB with AHSA1/START domain
MTNQNRHGSATVTLPSDLEILITRKFDAPAALVFKAYTTPELVKRWWGFHSSVWLVCEIDLRVGGSWRYVLVTADGFEVGFHGEYREIDPGRRIVTTEIYEGVPEEGEPPFYELTLTEHDGRTTLTQLVQCPNRQVRDMIVDSGMESGMQDSMDALERVAIELG